MSFSIFSFIILRLTLILFFSRYTSLLFIQVHAFIRSVIAKKFGHEIANKTIIQYGGSVKPDNVKEIMSMPDIDGCLVGGASLDAASFAKIVRFKDQ